MKSRALLTLSALAILLVSACSPEVPEELLPTRVPELSMDYFQQAEPAAAEAESTTAEEATVEEAATDEVDATPVPATAAVEDAAGEAEAPVEASAAAGLTETAVLTESTAVTEGVAVGEAPLVTETEVATAADAVAAVPVITEATAVTVTPLVTETVAVVEADVVTESEAAAPAPAAEEAVATEEPAAASPDLASTLLPAGFVTALASADTSRGEQLTLQNACIGCHNLDPNVQMAGPSWYNIAELAATRVEGQSAEEYLYNSIVYPNDYLVEGYAAGIMLQNYEDTLSEQDLADIVAYLLTIHAN